MSAGLRPAKLDEKQAWQTLVANVTYAADKLAAENIILCLEAINSRVDMPGFMLDTSGKVLALIEEVDADNPGRHETGTGEINFSNVFLVLDRMGYKGWVSAEYLPSGETEASLGWLSDQA